MCAINWKQVFHGIIGAAVGAGSVFLYMSVRDYFGIILPSWPISILSIIAAIIASVFIHELGHLIAGIVQKFRFYMFTVGPFKLEKTPDGFRAGLNLNLNIAGGLTLMIPSSKKFDKKKLAWFIAGGPIASILFFIILATVSFTLHAVYGAQGIANAIIYFSWMTAIITLVLGVFALIPEEETGLESDGLQLKDLLRGGKRAVIKQYVMQLSTASWNGTRPRDLDETVLMRLIDLTKEQNGSNSILAKLLGYVYFMDSDNKNQAKEILDKAVKIAEETKNEFLNATLFLEKSFFEAFCNHDVEKAEHYFEKGKKGYSEKSTLKRAETALNLVKGDTELARKNAEETLKLLENTHDKGGAIWEKEMLEQLIDKHGLRTVEK